MSGIEDERAIVRPMEIACEGVSFSYEEGDRGVQALSDVSFSLSAGATVALLGPTGSGKSTLLQVIRGLSTPDAGVVRLDGLSPGEPGYAERQRQVGIVFQTPEMQLFAMTCLDDVSFGPQQLGWEDAAVRAAAEEALERVGLPVSVFGNRHPYSLSGGEQRRLALAGVLAMRPRVLLLDEPFVSLDPAARRDLVGIVRALAADGVGLVLATHDVDQAWALCEERLVLDHGHLVSAGAWRFDQDGEADLLAHHLAVPFLVRLWQRLGRSLDTLPREADQAATALASDGRRA
jgi:energy-coupling factor transport system ATP-binding protein